MNNLKTLITIFSVFIALISIVLSINFGMSIGNTKLSTRNEAVLTEVKCVLGRNSEDMLTKTQFNTIVRIYEMQYELLLKLDRDEIETAKEMQTLFEDFRKEIIFGKQIPVRGSGKNMSSLIK